MSSACTFPRSQSRKCSSPLLRARCRRVVAYAAQRGPVVIVDNYDSFTYNLSQYLGDLKCEHIVVKNDERTVEELRDMQPRGILVSPGPGAPEESGISLEVCAKLGPIFPIFGVCMGHQCIGQSFGGKVIRSPTGLMHGMSSPVRHVGKGVLEGMPDPFEAARYHSLVIERDSCPECLEVTAWLEDGTIMAVQHKEYPHVQGVQFHPESIITDNGLSICRNWVNGLPPP
jgi:anthranilate synthase component II